MADEIEAEREEGREDDKLETSTPPDSGVMPRRRVAVESSEGSVPTPGGDSWVATAEKRHPSRRLDLRARGYGIAAGYEKPYRRDSPKEKPQREDSYGPLPHSGYYGAGEAKRPFKVGQAGFKEELEWYRSQYGRETSGYIKKDKSS